MAIEVTQNWWLVLLRGICAIIFGLVAFAWPGMTLYTLVLLYGAYALADGIFAIGAAVTRRSGRGTGWLMAVGVSGDPGGDSGVHVAGDYGDCAAGDHCIVGDHYGSCLR